MIRNLDYFLAHTIPKDSCMLWTRCVNTDGYPRATWNGHANGKVHRIVWELHNQASASGKVVRHTCDNPLCINPQHLILGTNIENVEDRTSRDRARGLKQKDVDTIKMLYAQGTYSALELAEMYQTSRRTIYYTLSNRKAGT